MNSQNKSTTFFNTSAKFFFLFFVGRQRTHQSRDIPYLQGKWLPKVNPDFPKSILIHPPDCFHCSAKCFTLFFSSLSKEREKEFYTSVTHWCDPGESSSDQCTVNIPSAPRWRFRQQFFRSWCQLELSTHLLFGLKKTRAPFSTGAARPSMLEH